MDIGSTRSQARLAQDAARRTRELARAALLTYLALTAAGCAAGGAAATGPVSTYADFRSRIGSMVSDGRFEDAAALMIEVSPSELAIAASSVSDVRYMVVGPGAVSPGISGMGTPSRTWRVPGTGDQASAPMAVRYQMAAYEFAWRFNETLAAEENGVR